MSLESFEMLCKTVRPFESWKRLSTDRIHSDLLQVLSILTMDRPQSFSSEDIRDEKVRRDILSVRRRLTCSLGQSSSTYSINYSR